MKKPRRKRAAKKPTHKFGVWVVPKDAVIVDGGIVQADEPEWETDFKRQRRRQSNGEDETMGGGL